MAAPRGKAALRSPPINESNSVRASSHAIRIDGFGGLWNMKMKMKISVDASMTITLSGIPATRNRTTITECCFLPVAAYFSLSVHRRHRCSHPPTRRVVEEEYDSHSGQTSSIFETLNFSKNFTIVSEIQ